MASRALAVAVTRIGGDLLPDNDQYTNRFTLHSESSSREYVVAQNKRSFEWSCSCPGWKMKKPGRERSCKHLKAIMPVLSCVGVDAPKRAGGVR